ncbi:hypothetical protein SLOPH_871 [Spraguea lophii 42_110]|uniref:Uncharacterized protein n=1 Tax=Spraguea lophii (strain 42_110) TaxID=1358809 RepID=S7WE89_SPRLO|nr:hypothetical protein SLOPH_871 [Spraguea lophii 42_110]
MLIFLSFISAFYVITIMCKQVELIGSLKGCLETKVNSACDTIKTPLQNKVLCSSISSLCSELPNCFQKLMCKEKTTDKLLPSYQCFLDFIVSVNQGLISAIIKMEGNCEGCLQSTLEQFICKEVCEISNIIQEGNRKLVWSIVCIFRYIIDEICDLLGKSSAVEIEKTDTLITNINNDLLNQIKTRHLKLKDEMVNIINNITTFTNTELASVITEANNSIYKQIEKIIDPKNDKPIIPQLIFPKPEILCPFLTFINDGMITLIENALTESVKDNKLFVEKAEKMAITQIALILNNGDKNLVDALNGKLNNLLRKLFKIVWKITKNEIIDIKKVLSETSALYIHEIRKMCGDILPDVEAQIIQVEEYILLETKKFLYCYNKSIIHQMIPTDCFK